MKRYYLLGQILDKCERSRNGWRENQEGNKSYVVQQEDYDRCGRRELIEEALELEKMGLVRIKWLSYRSDVERVYYRLERLPDYYRLTGRKPKTKAIAEDLQELASFAADAETPWLQRYYQDVLQEVERGNPLGRTVKKWKQLFPCLNAVEKLKEPVYVRIFSAACLGGSKIFERELKEDVVRVLLRYHPMADEAMEEDAVLSQVYLEQYSQELTVKGNLRICVDGREMDLSGFRYGAVLNGEMLRHASIPPQCFKRIITVENKANFMAMPYEEGNLLIFSHGFFSPRERQFLLRLLHAVSDAAYYHTGDLDYGGIRIFKYIRTQIFPELKPWQMDVQTYEAYLPFAQDMEPSAWEKLKSLEEPLLNPLIRRILEEKKTIEQECFLFPNT